MNWPGRALWPLVLLSACVGSERVEVRPPSLGTLPEPQAAAPPTSPFYAAEAQAPQSVEAEEPAPIPVRPASAGSWRAEDAYPFDIIDEVVEATEPETVHDAAKVIYRRSGGGWIWSDGRYLSTAAHRLMRLVETLDQHGVSGDRVRAERLIQLYGALTWNGKLLERTTEDEVAFPSLMRVRSELLRRLDAQLTSSALALARMLDVTNASGEELAAGFPEREGLEDWIVGLLPWHPQYARLTRAYQRYRRYRSFPDVARPKSMNWFRRLDEGEKYEVLTPENLKQTDLECIRTLRDRLAAEGFASGPVRQQNRFDAMLMEELRAFQYSRGLPVKGTLDKSTFEALNVPAYQHHDRIRRAMVAWRRSETRKDKTFVQVNLPEYTVEYYREGDRVLRQRVVVGYAYGSGGGRTKLFHSTLRQVTINPGWTPSDSILQKDLLPKEAADPGYLHRKGFRWFTRPDKRRGVYQLPGDQNALGRATLNFDNDYNIYLHGSPDDDQFELASRALSHGCVRVQAVEELAITLLEHDGALTRDEFERALDSRKTRRVELSQPLPIHFEYVTVVVDDDEQVRFLPNVYQL